MSCRLPLLGDVGPHAAIPKRQGGTPRLRCSCGCLLRSIVTEPFILKPADPRGLLARLVAWDVEPTSAPGRCRSTQRITKTPRGDPAAEVSVWLSPGSIVTEPFVLRPADPRRVWESPPPPPPLLSPLPLPPPPLHSPYLRDDSCAV